MNEQTQRACAACQRYVLATRPKVNHVLHFLVTFFTCGLWGLVWIFLAVFDRGSWRCPWCGGAT